MECGVCNLEFFSHVRGRFNHWGFKSLESLVRAKIVITILNKQSIKLNKKPIKSYKYLWKYINFKKNIELYRNFMRFFNLELISGPAWPAF